ncbi:hypothetical protein [Pedobacter sp. SYSU D00535]|uniref:hypothetical protein n=1 Tax=Pedobacter sp. SYSU D00535 TaxID=2810308 RepID=UPI001A95C631|nr:hypothetical protein [Pedobacter sp. SYSU D00535]
MKKLSLSLFVAVLLLMASSAAKAQYRHGLGVRVGDSYGITFKTFLESDKALDFILNVKNRDDYSIFRLTGLYEVHNPIAGAPGLRWYYGGGATVGSYEYKRTDESELLLSIDGVLGLDYKFAGAPINASLDWKPALVLNPYTDLDEGGFGLSIRFTF